MPIRNKNRVVTEKIVSVDLPLEYIQTGSIAYRVAAGTTALVIPTNIVKVNMVELVAMDNNTATVLSSGWHTTLEKTTSSNSTVSTVLGHTTAAATDVDSNFICVKDHILYECLRTIPAAQNPQNLVGVDSTAWRPVKFFAQGNLAENYLVINLRTAVAAATTIRLAYLVNGFEE